MNSLTVYTSVIRCILGSCVIASALIVTPAVAQSDPNLVSGADNFIELINQGDDNLVTLEQAGELNSLNLLIQASNVSANILQQGNANLVAGVDGVPAFTMTGQNSVVDIIQQGLGNQVFGMQLSANSMISVTQMGNGNQVTVIQR